MLSEERIAALAERFDGARLIVAPAGRIVLCAAGSGRELGEVSREVFDSLSRAGRVIEVQPPGKRRDGIYRMARPQEGAR